MARWGILGVLAVPIIEIALFVMIGGAIGLFGTFAVIIGTFFLGTAVLRRQAGLRVQGATAVDAAHQVLLFFAAILLIIPGFFTDMIGLLLLIRPLRGLLAGQITEGMVVRFGQRPGGAARYDDVLDGDYVDVTPKPAPTPLHKD